MVTRVTAAGIYTNRCTELAAGRHEVHAVATETGRAAVRISTLACPMEGCTGVSCAAQLDANRPIAAWLGVRPHKSW